MTEEQKMYKNKVVWLHKSKTGKFLYGFANEGDFHNVKSLLLNVSEVTTLINGDIDGIKISIMQKDGGETDELTKTED